MQEPCQRHAPRAAKHDSEHKSRAKPDLHGLSGGLSRLRDGLLTDPASDAACRGAVSPVSPVSLRPSRRDDGGYRLPYTVP